MNGVSFDIATVGTMLADEGVPFQIVNLRTGAPYMIDEAQTVALSITLMGRSSMMFRDTMEGIRKDREALQAQGKPIGREIIYDEDTKLLCACTIGWNFTEYKGQDFPCNPRNIRAFWTDRFFEYVRERALAFMTGDVNFLPASSKLSSGTRNITSDLTSPSPETAAQSATH